MILAATRTCVAPVASHQAQRAPHGGPPPANSRSRRSLLAVPALAWVVAAAGQPAQASENAGGVDSATSPLVQELLRRTEEKKAERAKERLDDYYRRNFGDYLSFQASTVPPGSGSENQRRIQEWLQKNVEPPLPAPRKQQ